MEVAVLFIIFAFIFLFPLGWIVYILTGRKTYTFSDLNTERNKRLLKMKFWEDNLIQSGQSGKMPSQTMVQSQNKQVVR
jgi:hypothetical protein